MLIFFQEPLTCGRERNSFTLGKAGRENLFTWRGGVGGVNFDGEGS